MNIDNVGLGKCSQFQLQVSVILPQPALWLEVGGAGLV